MIRSAASQTACAIACGGIGGDLAGAFLVGNALGVGGSSGVVGRSLSTFGGVSDFPPKSGILNRGFPLAFGGLRLLDFDSVSRWPRELSSGGGGDCEREQCGEISSMSTASAIGDSHNIDLGCSDVGVSQAVSDEDVDVELER